MGNEDQMRENGHNKTKHGIVTCILRSHQVSREKGASQNIRCGGYDRERWCPVDCSNRRTKYLQ